MLTRLMLTRNLAVVFTVLRPRFWGGHLLMLLAVAAAFGLSWWQFSAWQAQRTADAVDLTGLRPVALTGVMGPDDPMMTDNVGRPVTFTGRWMTPTMYVADRDLDGRHGYWVVTPVAVGESAMPVVRGFSTSRDAAPISGPATVTGWLQPGEPDAPDADPTDLVLPTMRIASMTQHVDRDLYSAFVVSKTPTTGLSAVHPDAIPDASNFSGLRNLLYAIQWIFFAAFAVFIWQRWVRDQLEAEDAGAEEVAE